MPASEGAREPLHVAFGREARRLYDVYARRSSMARKAKYDWGRSSNSRYQKFETRLAYQFDHDLDLQESVYIDIAQGLSMVNRKLVRQGHVFKVKGMKIFTLDTDGRSVDIHVSALPRTWMMFNAYKKARSLWNQMNLEAIDAAGSQNLPKYYDFKVFMDREHFKNHHLAASVDSGTLETNLLPCDSGYDTMAAGDWVYSKYETSASTPLEMNIHMLGGHADASGAIEGSSGRDLPADGGSIGAILAYQQSRGAAFTDQDLAGLDQNVDIDSPWLQLFAGDTQNQEVLTDLDVDNDGPPYPADYAGGIEHPEPTLISASGFIDYSASPRAVPSFEAPLGLVKLDLNIGGDTDNDVGEVRILMDTEIVGAC